MGDISGEGAPQGAGLYVSGVACLSRRHDFRVGRSEGGGHRAAFLRQSGIRDGPTRRTGGLGGFTIGAGHADVHGTTFWVALEG